jgi:hypothetical protein
MFPRQGFVSLRSNSLNVVAAEETKLHTTVVVVGGKRRRQQLQRKRYEKAMEGMAFPRACLPPILLCLNQLLNRRHLARTGTTRVRTGRIYKTYANSPTMPNNSGLVRQSENQAAHSARPYTAVCPVSPALKSHASRSNHAESTISPIQLSLEWTADLLDNLYQACFDLTRRLLTKASSLPTGTDHCNLS